MQWQPQQVRPTDSQLNWIAKGDWKIVAIAGLFLSLLNEELSILETVKYTERKFKAKRYIFLFNFTKNSLSLN